MIAAFPENRIKHEKKLRSLLMIPLILSSTKIKKPQKKKYQRLSLPIKDVNFKRKINLSKKDEVLTLTRLFYIAH